MGWVGVPAALVLIAVVLIDAFEAMILPRRVSHPWRLARLFYRATWAAWEAGARLLPPGRRRQTYLSIFGPLSLFALLALWAVGLILGFALLHWSLGTAIKPPEGTESGFGTYLYFCGGNFFTLGYGDVVPKDSLGRVLGVLEAGLGFGFLAIVISYLPVLYQAFSRREITISLLDARAGSPPSAGELLRRIAAARSPGAVGPLLAEWERWAAELLESHLSFPVLSYYRSQHDNQSWVGALTTILDSSALLIAAGEASESYQARLTFAMARHAAVDLAMTVSAPPRAPEPDRLATTDLARLTDDLRGAGMTLRDGPEVTRALAELRNLYEPFVNALADKFWLALPAFQPAAPPVDNWQTSAWMRRSPGFGRLPAGVEDEHFD
jgi:hypothetical protein